MNNLQATTGENLVKVKGRLLGLFLLMNALALLVTITLNFMGLPVLKYHYLIHIVITTIAVLLFEIPEIFPIVLTLLFIEGQGRIIWEYQSWARIIFDLIILIGVLKIFIKNKKIINLKSIPTPLTLFIILHFGWYIVEFFNINSTSFLSALFGLKIYIYPLFFFLAFNQLDFKVGTKKFDNTIIFFIVILILELSLNFYQYENKETSLTSISQYYSKVMRNEAFSGKHFRPFATSFIPGALSMFIYLTAGLLFLWKTSIKGNFFKIMLIAASLHALIICQIRSSFVKYVFIIFLILFGQMLFERFRSKKTIAVIFFLFIIFLGIQLTENISTDDKEIDIAFSRVLTLANPKKLNLTRLNLSEFSDSFYTKITTFPLGLGPGSSGAAAASGLEEKVLVEKKIDKVFLWTGDNLYIALILDFGIGALFYISLILYIPIYFFRFVITFYREKERQNYQTLLVCLSSITVIIIGNWGFLGLPYNPESFMFWFFSALGFSTIFKYKNDSALPS